MLTTKLFAPRPFEGFVPRPRLTEGLNEGLVQGLALVCAPAGFGKTALVADWARTSQRPVAWLSLDAVDNDPARFWRHVAAALDRLWPGIDERVIPLLGPPPPASFDGLVSALINELTVLGQDEGEVVLVLDDYHLIDSQPVHASLTFLLEHRPPAVAVVLTSRADPPLPLARLRVRGQLAEVRAAELRFTAPGGRGTAARIDWRGSARNSRHHAGQPHRAAGQSRAPADIDNFVATFGGSHRYVLDYLTEEVLERRCGPSQAECAFVLPERGC